jgi:small subunit ribosomal protein S2
MVDTNCDPNTVDYAIPANDDATKSVTAITTYLMNAVLEGIEERKNEKVDEVEESDENAQNNANAGTDAEVEGEDGARKKAANGKIRKPAHKVIGERKPR